MRQSPDTQKHTPGPWSLYPQYMGEPYAVVPEDGEEAWVYCSRRVAHGDKLIAEVSMSTAKNGGFPTVRRLDEMEANARLIAAAPELLEALKQLLADRYLADPINADRMAKASAAVAKAEGREVSRA